MSSQDIRSLLGVCPSSEQLNAYIAALAKVTTVSDRTVPEIKTYADSVYFNYFALGFSLLFVPKNGYKPKSGLKREDLIDRNLKLDGIDIYNVPIAKPTSSKVTSARHNFSTHPISPLVLSLPPSELKECPPQLVVLPETTGKDFVAGLGEPDRKGGGAGPSSGSISIWCEWSKDGIMVEFGGDEARGPQAWERGKDAVWSVITLFPPKKWWNFSTICLQQLRTNLFRPFFFRIKQVFSTKL
jgi:hypothetical protein